MQQILVPLALFICVTYTIKVLVEARLRHQLFKNNGSEELVRSILQAEQIQRRHASLRWGLVLVALGIGFGLIQWFGWQEINPGVVAVLASVAGLGNLAFFAISRRES
ncbi:hypothetical protein SAMN05216570_0612 [Dyella sp. OK004]|uniref:DUF6249 domain-containing protein n=1 Tax=Dyella sp. OK004 TaxID=1855292 RepID=UPI0008E3335B|nr:DUF6249 domain-containing protein [Dyella sp. OK004]SFR91836.1 hypothetical protein SAMN05216570_0612 [Dyella sp. OK004]